MAPEKNERTYTAHNKDLKPCHEGSEQVKDHREPPVIEPIETTEEPDENARVTRSRTKRGLAKLVVESFKTFCFDDFVDDGAVEDQRIPRRSSTPRGSSEERPSRLHHYHNRKSRRSTS
ncbi:hypothetical protein KQX54_013528 [Cotesia glomerata]|uniref:Uncharacterized protein n=1 Tax=Cotesia glomerata TaxID=32391 RepID=A0AAV7ISI3_COTGL|nr:hypothetical protein KQX54_013528 [Cotesia glomerata]